MTFVHKGRSLDRLAALDRPGEDNDVAAGDFAFAYDGNGNVVQVLDLKVADWQDPVPQDDFEWHGSRLAARYEYDAYGNVIGPDTNSDGQFDELDAPGHYAAENAMRFSTKYFDRETGLGNWGYRYYSPTLGRWVSRDPIEELGGHNLMLYVYNDPSGNLDAWGLTGAASGAGAGGLAGGAALARAMAAAAAAIAAVQAANDCGAIDALVSVATAAVSQVEALIETLTGATSVTAEALRRTLRDAAEAAQDRCRGPVDICEPAPPPPPRPEPKPRPKGPRGRRRTPDKVDPAPLPPDDRERGCNFYYQWCVHQNALGPGEKGGADYWTPNAPCTACYLECMTTGQWPTDACKMGGKRGPRWPGPGDRWPPVYPDPPGAFFPLPER